MSDLKETIADGLQVLRPATNPHDVVRLQEFEEALAQHPTTSQVESLVENHDPATGADSETVTVEVTGQQIKASVKIPDKVVEQEAESAARVSFTHPIAAADVLETGRLNILDVGVELRDGSGIIVASGVVDVDFSVNAKDGTVTILEGSNLITAIGQSVHVQFDSEEIVSGPALIATEEGLKVDLGPDRTQAARGDHSHDDLHPAATGAESETATVTVNEEQGVSVAVKLADSDSGLTTAGGLGVDFNEVARKEHDHAVVSDTEPGFMSPGHLAALEAAAGLLPTSVAESETVTLEQDTNGQIKAEVRKGAGLTSDENGLAVDFDVVAQKEHTHPSVTGLKEVEVFSGGAGYTQATITFATSVPGEGAEAAADIEDGVIVAIRVTKSGWGYELGNEPAVIIDGDGEGAIAEAHAQERPGFADKGMVDMLKDHESRMDTAETAITAHAAELVRLEEDKADTSYVDAGLAGKSNVGHTHAISDVTGLQAAIDDKADADHTHPEATTDEAGFMSSIDKQHVDCLSTMLQESEQARLVLKTLRLESPSLDGGNRCPVTIASNVIKAGGEAGTLYTVQVRVRGRMEMKDYTGGTNTGYINKNGTPAVNPHNAWKLIVSDPAATFYLNSAAGGTAAAFLANVDATVDVPVNGGATVTLAMDSVDGLQTVANSGPGAPATPGAIPNVPPAPAVFSGQFVQVDPIRLVGSCVYETLFGEAEVVLGGGTDGNGENGDGTGRDPNKPIEIIREFHRLDLIADGRFDDEVHEIVIDGKTVWVGGAFRKFDNIQSLGLAKLNRKLRYDPEFQLGSGFSQPVKFIGILPEGEGIVAGGILDSLCRASGVSKPLWKLSLTGDRDTGFTCPAVLNQLNGGANNSVALGEDVVQSVAVLPSGKIAVLSEQILTILHPDGTIFYQAVGNARFNWIRTYGEKLLLSSHAYAAANTPQTYNNTANPKGLKLLNFSGDWQLNFAAVGDYGKDGASEAAIAALIKAKNPDAVLSLGDNNYETGGADTIDANIGKHYRKFIYPYVGTQPLGLGEEDAVENKFWPVPGNHDWGNIITATGEVTLDIDDPGEIQSVAVLNPGAGYSSAPTVTVLGDGTGAAVTAVMAGSGSSKYVASFTVTNPGSGYTNASVVLTGGGHAYEATLQPYLDYFTLPGNERYYKRSFGNKVALFFMDSDKNEPDGYAYDSVQMQWLQDQLGSSPEAIKGVVWHHPPLSSETGYDATWMADTAALLRAWGAEFLLCGHAHVMEHIQMPDGLEVFIAGTGGKSLRSFGTPASGSVPESRINDKFGFIQLLTNKDSFTVKFWDIDGVERYSFTKGVLAGSNAVGEIDPVWALNTNAGTGAMSSCGVSVASPDGSYFVVGNALDEYNSPNTSWNVEQIGNMILWSEQFDNAQWVKVGTAPVVTSDFANNPAGSLTADKIEDSDSVDLAYIYQDVTIPADALRYVFSIQIKKDTDETRFPLIRLQLSGGPSSNDCYCYLNTKLGILSVGGTVLASQFTAQTEDNGTYWRLVLKINNTLATNFRVYIYPSYSSVFGSPSTAITGSIIAWGAHLRQDAWLSTYIATTGTGVVPANSADNSDRFRGLYKIKATGKEDLDFEVNITLSNSDPVKHVIPFGIDSQERIYFGGPVTSINDVTVAPWQLYRVSKDGEFERVFNLFDDKVLVARVTDCDTLLVGGAFTAYGSRKFGRILELNEDGSLVEEYEDDRFPIFSATEPDVITFPCFKDRMWVNIAANPHMLYFYDRTLKVWRSTCEICAISVGGKLPPPSFLPPDGTNAPVNLTMQVIGHPAAIIHYTIDGPDPDEDSPVYSGPIPILGETHIKAYARQPGFQMSDMVEAHYYDPSHQQVEPVQFSPGGGAFVPLSVVLTSDTPGATIYYEVGNPPAEPTTASAVYSTAVAVNSLSSIRAFAKKSGYADSVKTQADYVNPFRILNIQWRHDGQTQKAGAAGIGVGGDFWNYIINDQLAVSNSLLWADSTSCTADITVMSPPNGTFYQGAIVVGHTEALWKSYVRLMSTITSPVSAIPMSWYVNILDLPTGTYDIYAYTGRASLANLTTGQAYATLDAPSAVPGGEPPPWVERTEFVVWRDVSFVKGQTLRLSVLLNSALPAEKNGALHGIQIAQRVPIVMPRLPAPIISPTEFVDPGDASDIEATISLDPSIDDRSVRIYYTLDGSNPTTSSDSFDWQGGVVYVAAGQTLRAFCVAVGWQDSPIVSRLYHVLPPLPGTAQIVDIFPEANSDIIATDRFLVRMAGSTPESKQFRPIIHLSLSNALSGLLAEITCDSNGIVVGSSTPLVLTSGNLHPLTSYVIPNQDSAFNPAGLLPITITAKIYTVNHSPIYAQCQVMCQDWKL